MAQSSSENRSVVADRAIRDALRACTKGSRRDRVKAATRTLVLDYATCQSLLKGIASHVTYTWSKILGDFSQAYRSVGPDARLFVVGRLGQVPQ